MSLELGRTYTVTAEKIISHGVIVRLEDGTTELIHVSNISSDFVKNIQDYVTVGDQYEACCIESQVKPAELSLKHLNLTQHKSEKTFETTRKSHKNPSQLDYARNHSKRKTGESQEKDAHKSENRTYTKRAPRSAVTDASPTPSKPEIDKMIEAAQSAYNDKMRSYKSKYKSKSTYKRHRGPNRYSKHRGGYDD